MNELVPTPPPPLFALAPAIWASEEWAQQVSIPPNQPGLPAK